MVGLDRDILRHTLIVSYASNIATATATATAMFLGYLLAALFRPVCTIKRENYDMISFHYRLTWCRTRYSSDSD
jgi:hypothetical protein